MARGLDLKNRMALQAPGIGLDFLSDFGGWAETIDEKSRINENPRAFEDPNLNPGKRSYLLRTRSVKQRG